MSDSVNRTVARAAGWRTADGKTGGDTALRDIGTNLASINPSPAALTPLISSREAEAILARKQRVIEQINDHKREAEKLKQKIFDLTRERMDCTRLLLGAPLENAGNSATEQLIVAEIEKFRSSGIEPYVSYSFMENYARLIGSKGGTIESTLKTFYDAADELGVRFFRQTDTDIQPARQSQYGWFAGLCVSVEDLRKISPDLYVNRRGMTRYGHTGMRIIATFIQQWDQISQKY